MKKLLSIQKTKAGFTLIELLVVVAIIAILITLGAASYTTAARNGRDSQRKADLKKVQLALEDFFADHGVYPDEKTDDMITCSTTGTTHADIDAGALSADWGDTFTCPHSSGNNYMAKLPLDPLARGWNFPYDAAHDLDGYIYEIRELSWCSNSVGTNCQKYTLWARLENPKDPDRWIPGADPTCDAVMQSGGGDHNWYNGGGSVPPYTTDAWFCVHSP